jgi:hypothetical protein
MSTIIPTWEDGDGKEDTKKTRNEDQKMIM